jgi:hypothetical protein
MSTIEPNIGNRLKGGWGYIVATTFALISIWALVTVIGMFRLGSDAAALQAVVLKNMQGSWHKKIALRAGFFTTGAIRFGSRAIKLDAEPRAAIESLRGAEVAVYSLNEELLPTNYGSIVKEADNVMSARGWERIAGVSKDGKLVAIFAPRKASGTSLKLCVLVLDGSNLVIAAGKGEMKPLFDLAMKRVSSEMGSVFEDRIRARQKDSLFAKNR